jgi:Uma2 family endonuclease
MATDRSDIEDRLYTIEEYERLPEDGFWKDELVRGRLVREPGPGNEHGWLQVNVAVALRQFVHARRLGVVMVESGFVLHEDPPTVRCPDVSFVAADRLPPGGLPAGYLRHAPDLAVEIISPSNTAADVLEKVTEYLESGARQVWVVDPRKRQVVVHRALDDSRILSERDEMDGGDVLPGFRLPIAEIFADPLS